MIAFVLFYRQLCQNVVDTVFLLLIYFINRSKSRLETVSHAKLAQKPAACHIHPIFADRSSIWQAIVDLWYCLRMLNFIWWLEQFIFKAWETIIPPKYHDFDALSDRLELKEAITTQQSSLFLISNAFHEKRWAFTWSFITWINQAFNASLADARQFVYANSKVIGSLQ